MTKHSSKLAAMSRPVEMLFIVSVMLKNEVAQKRDQWLLTRCLSTVKHRLLYSHKSFKQLAVFHIF